MPTRGRPKKSEKVAKLLISVDTHTKQVIVEAAEQLGVSLSSFARLAMMKFIKDNELVKD